MCVFNESPKCLCGIRYLFVILKLCLCQSAYLTNLIWLAFRFLRTTDCIDHFIIKKRLSCLRGSGVRALCHSCFPQQLDFSSYKPKCYLIVRFVYCIIICLCLCPGLQAAPVLTEQSSRPFRPDWTGVWKSLHWKHRMWVMYLDFMGTYLTVLIFTCWLTNHCMLVTVLTLQYAGKSTLWMSVWPEMDRLLKEETPPRQLWKQKVQCFLHNLLDISVQFTDASASLNI